MSAHPDSPSASAPPLADANRPMTVPRLRARKGGVPLVCLAAYTTPVARAIDPHCDVVLVGDSVGMVLHGLPSTLGVTLDMMIMHGAAVRRGLSKALLVVDMPFGTYEASPAEAYRNAARIMVETGAAAVKLEGGQAMAETIAFLTTRGIPVMGHVGLMPQSVHSSGGYSARGTHSRDWAPIRDDATAVAAAGAFAVVVEAVGEPLARQITEDLAVPTIGIGASPACDGQILVIDDLLGMSSRSPRFVKRYAELGETIAAAASLYASEVRSRSFPAPEHTYAMKD
jgi:3-methyl-2-oxobutanoate hydroxymethyltransferase